MQTPNLQEIDTIIGHVRGPKGDPGETPEITVTDITGGHRLTITVGEEEPIVFDVMDGAKGDKGDKGDTGDNGVSPTITITNITGGHRVTITDAEHPQGQSIDVMDGDITQDVLDAALATKAPAIFETASGASASFPDGAADMPLKSLLVNIEPVQDLHGQSSPYPAGGGKNLVPMTVAGIKAANPNGTWSGNVYTFRNVTFTILTDSGGNVSGILINGTASATIQFLLSTEFNGNGSFILTGGANSSISVSVGGKGTDNGSGFSFTNNGAQRNVWCAVDNGTNANKVTIYPMIRLVTVSDSTFAPYSNLCPISGWTGCNVTRAGKNLVEQVFNGYVSPGTTNATFRTDSAKSLLFRAKKGETYVVSGGVLDRSIIGYFDSIPTDQDTTPIFQNLSNSTRVITAIADGIAVWYVKSTDGDMSTAQIELGSVATDFEPYNSGSELIPISWESEAGTVYGGTLDAVSGVLMVDRRLEIVDGNKIERVSTTAGGYNFAELKSEYFVNIQGIVVTNAYPVINAVAELGIRFASTTNKAYIYDNRFVNLQTAKDIADTTNIQVLCVLTTPVTYQLTPQEVTTLLGVNNIWADTGDVNLEYPADTKMYIQKINAPTDDDMIADTRIESGKYFLIGNTLYLSTTLILAGETVTPGTNCTKTNLAAALNALNA